MEIFHFLILKSLIYLFWCGVGLWLFMPPVSLTRLLGMSLVYGVLRLGLAMGFGFCVVLFFGWVSPPLLALKYIAIYAPGRCIEWSLILALMHIGRIRTDIRWQRKLYWVVGGVVISFALDSISPLTLQQFFKAGRWSC